MSIIGKFLTAGSPAAYASTEAIREAQAGHAEFEAGFSEFCKVLGMRVGELDKLPSMEVLTLMCMRLLRLMEARLEVIDGELTGIQERISP